MIKVKYCVVQLAGRVLDLPEAENKLSSISTFHPVSCAQETCSNLTCFNDYRFFYYVLFTISIFTQCILFFHQSLAWQQLN
jgi:hypothetical protein